MVDPGSLRQAADADVRHVGRYRVGRGRFVCDVRQPAVSEHRLSDDTSARELSGRIAEAEILATPSFVRSENAIARRARSRKSPQLDDSKQPKASIAATFTLSSDKTTDLVEVQRRVQSAEGNLPSDLVTPSIGSFDPGEPTVATLVVTSRSMTPEALSLLVNNQLVPDLEQVPGIANVNASGALTPAIEVDVNPRS